MVTAILQDNEDNEVDPTRDAKAYLHHLLDESTHVDEACRRAVRYCIDQGWLADIAYTITWMGFEREANRYALERNRKAFRENRATVADQQQGSAPTFTYTPETGHPTPLRPVQVSDGDDEHGLLPPIVASVPEINYAALTYSEDITYKIGGIVYPLGQLCVDQIDYALPRLASNILGNSRKYAILMAVRARLADDEARPAAEVLGRELLNRMAHEASSVRSFTEALRSIQRYDANVS